MLYVETLIIYTETPTSSIKTIEFSVLTELKVYLWYLAEYLCTASTNTPAFSGGTSK